MSLLQMAIGRVNGAGTGPINPNNGVYSGGNSSIMGGAPSSSSPRNIVQNNGRDQSGSNGGNRKYRINSRQGGGSGARGNNSRRHQKYSGDNSGVSYAGPANGEAMPNYSGAGGRSNYTSLPQQQLSAHNQQVNDISQLPQIAGPTSSAITNSGGVINNYKRSGHQSNNTSPSQTTALTGSGAATGSYGGGGLKDANSPYGPSVSATMGYSGAGPVTNNFTTTEEHSHSSVYSVRGLKPGNPNWINQDNFFVIENFDSGANFRQPQQQQLGMSSGDIRLYCVLDGHGEHGHLVSRRCREQFPQFIRSSGLDMERAFNMMQNDLNASDIDCKCSGATCVMATVAGGKLSVYNCGDSRAVLGRRNPNGTISAHALSSDHKPDRPEERKRILSCGGHLGCRQVLMNQPGGRGPVSMPVGPCRVWYQHRGETLGLAMSRSLGDSIVHKSGVSAEPEVVDHALDEHDEFLLLATDGVWDVVDNNHAVQMVHNFAARSPNWSTLEAANCVVKFARSRWEKLSPMIDDITCVVVKLQNHLHAQIHTNPHSQLTQSAYGGGGGGHKRLS